ncbi:MAG: hypothetical protein WCA46_03955 [Actinocatenispora sp.]
MPSGAPAARASPPCVAGRRTAVVPFVKYVLYEPAEGGCDGAVERIRYDFDALRKRVRPEGNQLLVALRARRIDDWAGAFLARNPDATVLQLGCGLDSRMLALRDSSVDYRFTF